MSKSENNPTAIPHKRRAVISYENMSPELQAAFKEKYPKGYSDYMGDLFKVDKPDGTFFYAVSVEIPDAIYLVKMSVKVDDYEEAENELFNDGAEGGDEVAGDDTFPEEGTENSFSAEEEPEED